MSPSTRSSSSSSTTVLLIAVVLVLGAALAFALLGGDDAPASDFDLAAIEVPTVSEGSAVDGGQAPVVEGASLLGEGTEVVPVEGEATMIVFLAHWCSHCNAEVPVVVDWLATDPLPEGVQVRAVATGIDETAPHFPPDTWLEQRDWPTPVVVDTDGSIGDAYGITGYPTWVFVAADGTVLGRGGAQDEASLQQLADALAAA